MGEETMKLKQVAALTGGTLQGNPDIEISGIRAIEDAGETDVTFLTKKKYLDRLGKSKAAAVIVDKEIETDKAQIITPNPQLAFARLLTEFYPKTRPEAKVDPRAAIGQNVTFGDNVTVSPLVCIGDNVSIGDDCVFHPGVVIGEGCRIGDHTTLFANVTLYHNITLGKHVTLHAGVVIGGDGFGYTVDEKGQHYKIPQLGDVVIEDHVEVGANSCIDRGAMGTTLIKTGTKVDNLAQIAHNVTIGEHSIIVAQVGIAGSCTLGHHVVLGGQVGVTDHVNIGDQAMLAAKTGAFRDIESNGVYGGVPSLPMTAWRKAVTIFAKLPEIKKKIKEFEARLNAIEKKDSAS